MVLRFMLTLSHFSSRFFLSFYLSLSFSHAFYDLNVMHIHDVFDNFFFLFGKTFFGIKEELRLFPFICTVECLLQGEMYRLSFKSFRMHGVFSLHLVLSMFESHANDFVFRNKLESLPKRSILQEMSEWKKCNRLPVQMACLNNRYLIPKKKEYARFLCV